MPKQHFHLPDLPIAGYSTYRERQLTDMVMTFHKHRIVPGHVNGTYEPSNVVRVNPAMHAFLHKCLWEEHGRWQDRVAWQVLTGMISKEQGRLQAVSEAKREQWKDPVFRAKMKIVHSRPSPSQSVRAKAAWQSGPLRARLVAATKRRWADPAEHERMSAKMKGGKGSLGHKHSPDALAQIGAASKAQWAARSPEQKAQMIANRVASRLRNSGAR